MCNVKLNIFSAVTVDYQDDPVTLTFTVRNNPAVTDIKLVHASVESTVTVKQADITGTGP